MCISENQTAISVFGYICDNQHLTMPDRRRRSARDELHRFARTSTMRGVPRILNSDHLSIKIIWVITVLSLVAFAIYQVTEVVNHYLQNEYYMTLEESSFHPTDDKPVYPSLSVCKSKL